MIIKEFNDHWLFETKDIKKYVSLPHDAMQEEKRYAKDFKYSGNAYFDGGFYTYKKTFSLPYEFKDRKIFLEVLGSYPDSKIILNNQNVFYYNNGYQTYYVDLTDYIQFGSSNLIQIECDNTKLPNSRWYSGAGLYRGLNLWIANKSYIIPESVKINVLDYNPVTISYNLDYVGSKDLEVIFNVYDDAKLLKSIRGKKNMFNLDCILWSDLEPKLYNILIELVSGNDILDTYSFNYGFRHLEYTTKGLFVNGKKTILKGCCLHHDNGIVGARSYFDMEYHKLEILKEYGFNAIRSAHNPASKTLLDACDQLGIYVMDELSDMWYEHKNPYDYALYFEANYMKDLKLMIDKDYNHPSVIMYSLGNELSEPTSDSELGLKILKDMVDYIHQNDYRKSTMGINFTNLPREELFMHKTKARMFEVYENKDSLCDEFNDVIVTLGESMADISTQEDSERVSKEAFKLLDLAGYNYAFKRYALDDEIHKERIIVGTETMAKDIYQNFNLMKKYPRVIGDFIWTGIDYLGEVGIGGYGNERYFAKPYPWILANGGALDLLYQPTGEAALAKVTYTDEELLLFTRMPKDDETLSAWRWTNSINTYSYGNNIGKKVVVEVYSKHNFVELFVNGKSKGIKEVTKAYTEYEIEYEPGILMAKAYNLNKEEVKEVKLQTVSDSKLQLEIEYEGRDLTLINVFYKDSKGILDTTKEEEIKVSGDGFTLLGFGSANPKTIDNYLSNTCHTWKGMARIAIKKLDKASIKVQSLNEEAILDII